MEIYQSRSGPLPKGVPQKRKLVMSTTKTTLMSKEVTDMKIQSRQVDPFTKHRDAFKMSKFRNVKGVVDTNRKAFSSHSQERLHQGGDGQGVQQGLAESQRLPPIQPA